MNVESKRWHLRADGIADQATLTDKRTRQHRTVHLADAPSATALAQMHEAAFDRAMGALP